MQKEINSGKESYKKPFLELLKETEEIASDVEQIVRAGQSSPFPLAPTDITLLKKNLYGRINERERERENKT